MVGGEGLQKARILPPAVPTNTVSSCRATVTQVSLLVLCLQYTTVQYSYTKYSAVEYSYTKYSRVQYSTVSTVQ